MLAMFKNAMKKAQDNWLQLSLGSIFAVGVITMCTVFPPAILPTYVAVAALVLGTALYQAYQFSASFFTKSNATAAKPAAAVTDAATATSAPTAEKAASSSATIASTLAANPAAEKDQAAAAKAAEPVVAVTPKAADKAPEVVAETTPAANDADAAAPTARMV